MEFSKTLSAQSTPISGLELYELPVMGDNRGWFKENWQREKMVKLGLPDFVPVQNNVSFNEHAGTTRGIHAEPWDKFISVAAGRIFGAWVDLREGPGFGTIFTAEISPSRAVFVPHGVGNAFQTLEDNTVYSYLVNDHWSPEAKYTFLNLADETVAIDWPIPLEQAALSEKDRNHPRLESVTAMAPKKILVLGANGQLGRSLREVFANDKSVEFCGREDFDLLSPESFSQIRWKDYRAIINAAAYTAVDAAETEDGRRDAWALNVQAVAELAKTAAANNLTLVHVSSDYVFDGSQPTHRESERFSPLGVYGQSKAAGDAAVMTAPKHYIIRTSWVIGEGRNFVRTMNELARRRVSPKVVNDQFGRLTFTSTLAEGIKHLLVTQAPFGTYNVTNDGPAQSWADVAKEVFRLSSPGSAGVLGVSTEEYYADKDPGAPRPRNSLLSLDKIKESGFTPLPASELLSSYVTEIGKKQ